MDGLYWRFINRNRTFFLKNPRLSMMVSVFDKMKMERKKMVRVMKKTWGDIVKRTLWQNKN